MSFIRRADGTTVYNGSHAVSRGSLSSIRYGGSPDDDYFSQIAEEDLEWERQVMATAVSMYDSVAGYSDYFDQDEYEPSPLITRLWGIYQREMCPHLTVGFEKEGCFRRAKD